MSRNNAISTILVADNNTAVLAKDLKPDALTVGQLGVFDANTGLSVDATSASPREFFLAVGLVNDIKVSAGQYIQRDGVVTYNFREHSAAQPMIVKVANYLAECETTYAIRVEFRNQQIYRTQGHNQFSKTYAIKTDCCDTCETCYSADANEVTLKMVAEINLDESNLITAKAVARQDVTIEDHGTSADIDAGEDISDADIAVLIAFNALETTADEDKVYTDIVITASEQAINQFAGSVNLLYYNPRGTALIISVVDGFNCNSGVETIQELAFEEGNGYDLAQKEWHAGGVQYNQPYVLNDTGVPYETPTYANKSEKYDQFVIEYDFTSQMNGKNYHAQLDTIVAVPNGNTVARNSIATLLDKVLTGTVVTGFDAKADDAAAANTGDTVVSPTEDKTKPTDGLD